MSVWPKNGTNMATLYMGFFTTQTASTVPTAGQTLGGGVTEAAGTSYARQSIAAASWGAQAAGSPDGRKTTAGIVTWPAVGAGGWGTLNGFFLSSVSTLNTGPLIFCANFDDVTAVVSSAGDVVTVTPFINFGA